MKRGALDHPKMHMLTTEIERVYKTHRKGRAFGGRAEAIGILEMLFEWASKYAIQGDVGKWPDDIIARGIGWIFSGKELIACLISSGWLDKAPDPHRLVIHDIQDHAPNSWRQNLEDAGLTWWDGSPPRRWRISKTPEKLQKNSRNSPQPKPEPKPEPERERTCARETDPERSASDPDGPDGVAPGHAEEQFERMWEIAPKKTGRHLAERALTRALLLRPGDRSHAQRIENTWVARCRDPAWTEQNGRYAPRLDRWLDECRWEDGMPGPVVTPARKKSHVEAMLGL